MKKAVLGLALVACSFSALADIPAEATRAFCASRQPEQIKELSLESFTRMSFQNQGGLANGGVCWWHSRFQRNALYLTVYSPKKERPSYEQAKQIIAAIRAGKSLVEVPGFYNFNEFSNAFGADILRELEKWQKGDGFLRAAWIKGLAGSSVVSAEKMKAMMDELYQEVEVKGNITYEKLQLKGITAHAWLVNKVEKTADGYDLYVIDSNYPDQTISYQYRVGGDFSL